MKNDNAKPAVITAAEFVAGGYAERIAAGECVVRYFADNEMISVAEPGELTVANGMTLFHFRKKGKLSAGAFLDDARFTVEWLPATPSTDDEVTRLRAENARLRAALDKCARLWPGLGCTIPEEWMSKERHYQIGFQDGLARVSRIARAELDATGEAQS